MTLEQADAIIELLKGLTYLSQLGLGFLALGVLYRIGRG